DATVSLDLERADMPADPALLTGLLPEVDWLFLNRRTRDHLQDMLGGQAFAGARRVITTLGADGCRLDQAGEHITVGAHAVRVRDTTGAGDAFVAAFLHYHLAQGRSAGEALRSANAAGALVVQQYGAQAGLPTPGDVASALKRPCGAD
ncbi:MAG: carbohydrate kinase family protein, partial [Gammaproteobacteria bacterium]